MEHPLLPWLFRHAGFLLNRFAVKSSGRAPYEKVFGRRYSGELALLGESVWARQPKLPAKMEARWLEGYW
eukprot:2031607-Alexandrium_andersonii.AAC.1